MLILALLALLFWFLLKWSHRLDQASYLGQVYKESVEDFEYKRLATVPIEKLQKGEYLLEVQADNDWLERHARPKPPPGYRDPWAGRPGSTLPPGISYRATASGGSIKIGTPRGGDSKSQPLSESEQHAQEAYEDYLDQMAAWNEESEIEAAARYQRALASAREQAKKRTVSATDVDLSVLRGRGAEFVLEFTTVVVIIFAAVVLGVLDILGTEQIGTLLAAIAGYVLGRATTRGRATEARTEEKPLPETEQRGKEQ